MSYRKRDIICAHVFPLPKSQPWGQHTRITHSFAAAHHEFSSVVKFYSENDCIFAAWPVDAEIGWRCLIPSNRQNAGKWAHIHVMLAAYFAPFKYLQTTNTHTAPEQSSAAMRSSSITHGHEHIRIRGNVIIAFIVIFLYAFMNFVPFRDKIIIL